MLDVADVKRRLIAAWSGLQQHVIDETSAWTAMRELMGDTSNTCVPKSNNATQHNPVSAQN